MKRALKMALVMVMTAVGPMAAEETLQKLKADSSK
jgi:hypothetical protein